MTRPFQKPPTTYGEQVSLLKARGMTIADPAAAEFYLKHLNYYRLAAYWLPFETDHANHIFKVGTRFEDVLNLYIFDRELRLLVLDAIERVEVSARCQWAYCLAHMHGPHAHLDPALAISGSYWRANYEKLEIEVLRSEETFIRHLRATYSEPLPPVWAVCEVMSLGLLSRYYNQLKPMPTRRAIATTYGLDERVLQSWLHHLSVVRNVCAHHARLWNREFSITPLATQTKPATLKGQFVPGSRKLYNTLVILLHFVDIISPKHHWRARLLDLIDRHGVPVGAMDFPKDWNERTIWQGGNP